MTLINLSSKFNEIKNVVEKVPFADIKLTEVFRAEYERYIDEYKPNGYSGVEWAEFSTKIITSSGKQIFLTNFWFYIASELAVYMEGLERQRDIFKAIYEGEDIKKAAESLRGGISRDDESKIKEYFDINYLSADEYTYFLEFITNYKGWGGGKTIDRNDYYVSPLLQAGNLLAETQSAIAEIAKQFSESSSLKKSFSPVFVLPDEKKENLNSTITTKDDNKNSIAVLSKPFLLLAGISGTGKTRFVREQAKASGSIEETYCLVSVRPDWHEPSDLLGYISRLSGKPEYVATDTLRFIVQAWKNIITIIVKKDSVASDWRGHPLSQIKPFWLCLDEMNLAPVEQYFSDYLSVLETRCWYSEEQLDEYNSENGTDLEYLYHCDPLLKSNIIKSLDDSDDDERKSSNELASSLGLDLSNSLDDDIWQYFYHNGISIPFNLIVAGTVNMDETTHGFSRKVIDRALSFDFGEFFPNDFDHFSSPVTRPKVLSYPVWSDAQQHLPEELEESSNAKKSIDFLKSVNTILKNTPFELAFRALNELLLAVISSQPENELQLQAVWDDFLMCKVLPRIEGDHDKLATNDDNQSLLYRLNKCLATNLASIWHESEDSDTARPDLYRENIGEADKDKPIRIACRSKAKVAWMQDRLTHSSFTSFWP